MPDGAEPEMLSIVCVIERRLAMGTRLGVGLNPAIACMTNTEQIGDAGCSTCQRPELHRGRSSDDCFSCDPAL